MLEQGEGVCVMVNGKVSVAVSVSVSHAVIVLYSCYAFAKLQRDELKVYR